MIEEYIQLQINKLITKRIDLVNQKEATGLTIFESSDEKEKKEAERKIRELDKQIDNIDKQISQLKKK